jgi:DNA repair protein RadC
MKDLPPSDRPRERMLAKSAKHLSQAELLAILLGTGSAKQNVLALSQSIVKHFPENELKNVVLQDLVKIPGVGNSKAARILAALELGERLFAPTSLTKVTIASTEDLLPHIREYAGKKQEYLVVFYLNTRNELIQKEIVGVGSLNSMMITPKEIFHHALTTPCASIIVVHNHPSGDPTPS